MSRSRSRLRSSFSRHQSAFAFGAVACCGHMCQKQPFDEDCDLRGAEHHVGPSAHAREDGSLDAVAQARRVQRPTQLQLRTRVPPPLLLHPAANDGRRGGRPGHQTCEKVVSYSLAIRTIMLP